ncbi:MAG: hypothetical protein U5L72_12235 [Bacteroidales bacterium]|nr:hypothetical protein [Bacteroidales bacterium]
MNLSTTKTVFGSDVPTMYSERAVLCHPISVNLAQKLQEEFRGELLLSFSAGADAFNIAPLLSCGFRTVTVCTDLLKPGGYMRLHQYFSELNAAIKKYNAKNINDFITRTAGLTDLDAALQTELDAAGMTDLDAALLQTDLNASEDLTVDEAPYD